MAEILKNRLRLKGAIEQTELGLNGIISLVELGDLTAYVCLGTRDGGYICNEFFGHFGCNRGYFHYDYGKAGDALCFDCRELQPYIDAVKVPDVGLCSRLDYSGESAINEGKESAGNGWQARYPRLAKVVSMVARGADEKELVAYMQNEGVSLSTIGFLLRHDAQKVSNAGYIQTAQRAKNG